MSDGGYLSEMEFRQLWTSLGRTVPVAVAFVHARHESSLNVYAYNDESAYDRRHGVDVNAIGLFQQLDVNFEFPGDVMEHRECDSVEEFALYCMAEYDLFFGRFYDPENEWESFRRYNGSGPAAEAYADALVNELEVYRGRAEPLPPDDSESGSGGGLALAAVALAVIALN